MRKFTLPLMIAALMLATAFITIGVARGQGSGPQIINRETQGDSVREITSPDNGAAPLDGNAPTAQHRPHRSPSAAQPDPSQNTATLAGTHYRSMRVPSMITMMAFLNNLAQLLLRDSSRLPCMCRNMLGQGFKVPW
jgi:hypothetical protein